MEARVEKIVDELSRNERVIAVYLFGSMASGRARPYSDIDICVVSEPGDKGEILCLSSKDVDIVLFFDLPLGIRYRIIKEGKLLYLKDRLKLHRIAVRAVKEYLDFKPVIERGIRRTLGVKNV